MWEAASSAGELLASPPSAVLQRAETAAMSSLSLSLPPAGTAPVGHVSVAAEAGSARAARQAYLETKRAAFPPGWPI